MMGPVSAAIIDMVRRQLRERGVVLWLDPEGLYEALLPSLAEHAPVERWDGSAFDLRARCDAALQGEKPGSLVAYARLSEEEAHQRMPELHAAAAVLRPGSPSQARNTRLSLVARNVLREILPAETLESDLARVEAGALSLSELDELASRHVRAVDGVLQALYHGATLQEVALAFVSDSAQDGDLVARGALPALAGALATGFGLDRGGEGAQATRQVLVRHILGADYAAELPADVLPHLARPAAGQRAACRELARCWRQRADLRSSYASAAGEAQSALGVTGEELPPERARDVETFEAAEHALQRACERAATDGRFAVAAATAEARLGGFWAAVEPSIMSRWQLVASAARLLSAADRIARELPGCKGAGALARAYALGEAPWCEVDALHRRLEGLVHVFDFGNDGEHASTEALVARVRARHAEVASALAERFVDALVEGGLPGDLPAQRETYERHVKPALAEGKTAYVLVDGLRYEMARELEGALGRTTAATLHVLLGALPSVTEVGMAALLPRAHLDPALVAQDDGGLALRLHGEVLATRQERMRFLAERASVPVFATKLDALLPPTKKTQVAVREAALVLVTATEELDGLCEHGNVAMARRLLEDVLSQLARAARTLFELGATSVVITADHGHIFGEPVEEASRIDPPGGETMVLRRRAWVGKGGAAGPAFARFTARQLGFQGDLEVAVPRGLGCFKAPGPAPAYLHGGASPQELLVPVLVLRASAESSQRASVNWTIAPGSKALSSRFLSVGVGGTVAGLWKLAPVSLRVEIRDGKKTLSRAVAASYGFEEATGGVLLEPDADAKSYRTAAVTLLIDDRPTGDTVTVSLVDPATSRSLASVQLPVKLAGF